jgi:hypothetical protein
VLEIKPLNVEVDQHVKAALLALGRRFAEVSPAGQAEVASIARQLAAIQGQLARPSAPAPALTVVVESDDERIDRQDEESADRIDVMLSGLCLSTADRQFSQDLGERIVELVSEVYAEGAGQGGHDAACIAAAVTVALMTVCDRSGAGGPTLGEGLQPSGRSGGPPN